MFQDMLLQVRDLIWGLPFLVFVTSVGFAATVSLGCIQFRKFFSSWSLIFSHDGQDSGQMSPLQAFLNALSASLGNGSIAGIATAIHTGGPGATFWIFMIGFLGMILRFCEVFLATSFSTVSHTGRALGGPFLYLSKIPGGSYWPTIYALCCLGYSFSSGNSMQCNSISMALTQVIPALSPLIIGIFLTIFVAYILLGGANRIVKISSYIVPLKVGLFFVSCTAVLLYHWAAIIPAIILIVKSAFNPQAFAGAAVGVTVQQLFSSSLTRTINASEAGLGTAGVIYGSVVSKNPLNDGLSAMLGTFISANLVCTMVALSIVASGAWQGDANGSALTSQAFQTVFGIVGGWIVTALTLLFGIGVFVAYGFIGRQCWLFLTKDRFEHVFTVLFSMCALWGSVADVSIVWAAIDVVNGGCLLINLFGILWLLPYIRSHVMPLLRAQ
jgi:alanine or glycine:cation symporter, AGCS family